MKINQLDLFSGIGGFHLGFERAGYEVTSYFSEVDKHAIAVYKHQFPNSTYVGSVTDVRGAELPTIDLITFGSPCQDFSLAGKRLGMEGQRSSLILEAIRLIGECRPSVFVWENVKGTFSSNNGADFWAIIQAFTDIGGYRLEWQLLNTSWFLPQNRERIYLVGYLAEPKRGGRGIFPISWGNGKDNVQRIKVVEDRGTGGQQGLIYGDDGIAPCLNAHSFADPMKIKENFPQAVVEPMIYDDYNSKMRTDNNVGTITANIGSTAVRNGQKVIEPNYKYEAANELVRKNNLIEGEVKGLDFYNQSVRDVIPTLTDPKHNSQGLFDGYRIRRLTPIECERLQGFPDDHTAYGNYDGEVKPMSNTQRYKQCGNAVTVDVVAAVAKNCLSLFK